MIARFLELLNFFLERKESEFLVSDVILVYEGELPKKNCWPGIYLIWTSTCSVFSSNECSRSENLATSFKKSWNRLPKNSLSLLLAGSNNRTLRSPYGPSYLRLMRGEKYSGGKPRLWILRLNSAIKNLLGFLRVVLDHLPSWHRQRMLSRQVYEN